MHTHKVYIECNFCNFSRCLALQWLLKWNLWVFYCGFFNANKLHNSKCCDNFGLLENVIRLFPALCCIYICENHMRLIWYVCKKLYMAFSNGIEQLKIIWGFCEYCDRLIFSDILIYMLKSLIRVSDFLAFKILVI